MKSFDDKVAAITGAGSGIGRALALALASERCALALCDVNEDGLAETAELCSDRGVAVTRRRVDVSDESAVRAFAKQVVSDHGRVHLVINNAGVALAGPLREVRREDFVWLMNVNFWGVVNGTTAFLPHLEQAGEGHVVNVSSVFGIIAAPLNGTYNAAKFAVRGYTEALRMELELDGSPVSATCVHPGGIRTNIARTARVSEGLDPADIAAEFDRLARMPPERCAEIVLDAVRRNDRRVLVGADAHAIDSMQRLAPARYQDLVKRLVGRQWDR